MSTTRTGDLRHILRWLPTRATTTADGRSMTIHPHHGRRIKLRYLGVTKNHTWLRTRAAAINLRTRAAAINLRTLTSHGLTHRNGSWALEPPRVR